MVSGLVTLLILGMEKVQYARNFVSIHTAFQQRHPKPFLPTPGLPCYTPVNERLPAFPIVSIAALIC
jgi:hypothetical protein